MPVTQCVDCYILSSSDNLSPNNAVVKRRAGRGGRVVKWEAQRAQLQPFSVHFKNIIKLAGPWSLSNGAKGVSEFFLTEVNYKKHTKCSFNMISFIGRNNVFMFPTEYIFLEQV